MKSNVEVLRAKWRILKELQHVPCTKGEINYIIRHMPAAARNQAFDELINDSMVEAEEKVTFRPGRNPQQLSITPTGREELKRLTKQYK